MATRVNNFPKYQLFSNGHFKRTLIFGIWDFEIGICFFFRRCWCSKKFAETL